MRTAVVDRLRLFLNRPLRDADRPRMFVVAVAAIIAAAAALALLDDIGPAPTPARTDRAGAGSTDAAGRVEAPSTASPTATPALPSEEGRPARESVASRAEVARAKRLARRFLRGYLRFSYGRGATSAIVGSTDELRRRLAEERPRVPAKERRRRPRLVLVQSDSVSRAQARLLAFVSDGKRRYTVPLELVRTRAGWRVVSVGS